jgi:hypothetical protein
MTIPYDLDPSLHNAQPHEPSLDDGFSRPDLDEPHPDPHLGPAEPETLIGDKSAF